MGSFAPSMAVFFSNANSGPPAGCLSSHSRCFQKATPPCRPKGWPRFPATWRPASRRAQSASAQRPSDVAPGYAPPGQALISVSFLGQETSPELESRVLLELETWFGEMVREWRHLRTYRIQRALPEQAPGSGFSGPGFQRVAGVYVCGDHLWSPSIEGAIVSGLRTAEAILRPS
ncbi:MAG: hypothetical protein EBS05_22925 [Proteobacteria bacterium]|nr:hypothetical protein [Pseudomonadota bacterium]